MKHSRSIALAYRTNFMRNVPCYWNAISQRMRVRRNNRFWKNDRGYFLSNISYQCRV